MFETIIHFAHWIEGSRLLFPKQIEIYHHRVIDGVACVDIPTNAKSFNVLNIANEPEPTRMSNQKVLEAACYYDLILTWDEKILEKCSNAEMFYCGMTWIREEDIECVIGDNKRFEVTTFCGGKDITLNHRMRHKLWNRQNEITIPNVFWNSNIVPVDGLTNNPSLGRYPHEKIEMFYAQYHIAIENVCHNNYFSEKLMDCFMTETIPIYVGCPNIDNFFDTDGMIIANNEDDIISICNSLNPKLYESKRKSIENNKELCKKYCTDFTDRIYETLKKHF